MKITNEYIQSLKPCEDGMANFNKHYPNYDNTLVHLLSLEHVPYLDKTWLVNEVLDKTTLISWGLKCARSVAHIYNDAYPNDNRVNDCLDVTERYLRGDADIDELHAAKYEAKYVADATNAACPAVNAASNAIYSAVNSAAYAAYASYAAYAAINSASNAASAAKYAASNAACAAENAQQQLNLTFLIEVINEHTS